LAGTFVKNVKAGEDLTGLSIELKTEIFQWREVIKCGACEGYTADESGNCGQDPTSCTFSFEKAWLSQPLPSQNFQCKTDEQ